MKNQPLIKTIKQTTATRPDMAALVMMAMHLARQQMARHPNSNARVIILVLAVQMREMTRDIARVQHADRSPEGQPEPAAQTEQGTENAQRAAPATHAAATDARQSRGVMGRSMDAMRRAIGTMWHQAPVAEKQSAATQVTAPRPQAAPQIVPDHARPITIPRAQEPAAQEKPAAQETRAPTQKLVRPKSPLGPAWQKQMAPKPRAESVTNPAPAPTKPQVIGSRPLPPRSNPVATIGNQMPANRAQSVNPVAVRSPAPMVPLRGDMNTMRQLMAMHNLSRGRAA